MQLGFLPRFEVQYTSEKEQGQVYLPGVNWGLFVAVVIDPQLLRPGRAAARQSGGRRQSLLPYGARMAAVAAGCAGDAGNGDRSLRLFSILDWHLRSV